jgi:hypothetical protein
MGSDFKTNGDCSHCKQSNSEVSYIAVKSSTAYLTCSALGFSGYLAAKVWNIAQDAEPSSSRLRGAVNNQNHNSQFSGKTSEIISQQCMHTEEIEDVGVCPQVLWFILILFLAILVKACFPGHT